MRKILIAVLIVTLMVLGFSECTVSRPRGVSISKASLYKSGHDFTCFDGSGVIPFERINDDYCDCADGSDEPGTSACPNGYFHCTNAGHKPMNIPSSRVNDGICDCCDGTDEYGPKQCKNTCRELGRAAREEAEKHRVLVQEGHGVYKDYVKQGTEALGVNKLKLDELEKEKADIDSRKDELQALKEEAEIPEKEAKDKHREKWQAEVDVIRSMKIEKDSKEAFELLDKNGDGKVCYEEIQTHSEFDIDSNGEVSEDEAREYLEDHDEVDFATFRDTVWPNIKEILKTEGEQTDPRDDVEADHEPYDENADDYTDGDEDDEYGDEDDGEDDEEQRRGEGDHKPSGKEEEEHPMPDYDEETQALIDVADKAREDYQEIETRSKEIDKEIGDINKLIQLDFGPSNEFYPLKGNCYEYTDREYTYKLCPFDRTSQRSKSGGSETSLGTWGKWDGSDDNIYSAMKYERGQNCWNGPDRSVRIILSCGVNNELRGASEPNRCEYQFEFTTPALCKSIPPSPVDVEHDEL